jgi:hypothetical protein
MAFSSTGYVWTGSSLFESGFAFSQAAAAALKHFD